MTIFLQSTIDKQVHIGHLSRKTLFHITILYFTVPRPNVPTAIGEICT